MSTLPTLDSTGACTGITFVTPVTIKNSAGLDRLSWRVGTHSRFKESQIASLSTQAALRPLSTRDDDDPTLALVDAWASALDVLTFYQERYANENYLRTATERRSLQELSRSLGYELSPGVSAHTVLAFSLETSPGAPLSTRIPAGSKVQSVPGQDEKPQLYETAEELVARPTWNTLPLRTTGERRLYRGQTELHLAGVSSGLQVGDSLLLVGNERDADPANRLWKVVRIRELTLVNDPRVPSLSRTIVKIDKPLNQRRPQDGVRVFGLRQKASLFGAAAPDWNMLPRDTRVQIANNTSPGSQWPKFNIAYSSSSAPNSLDQLLLEGSPKAAVKGAWMTIKAPGKKRLLFRITQAIETGASAFGLAGKATRVRLEGETNQLASEYWSRLRETQISLATEEFTLIEPPLTHVLEAGALQLELDAVFTGDDELPAGRLLSLCGRSPLDDSSVSELIVLERVEIVRTAGERDRTRLVLSAALSQPFAREGLVLWGNVVPADHGETTRRTRGDGAVFTEVLGSGDRSVAFQKFSLKQAPLTHVGAATESGRVSTLQIRVDGVLWHEVPSFIDASPADRVFITREQPDGKVSVCFGDGVTGARLPTGVENVTALYRVGIGLAGQVRAGQLSLLMSRPPGVREVTNPLPGTGAADPESVDNARTLAPLTTRTLGRIVSLTDYEDFARTFAGVGKASARLLWTGETQSVHLTVALADGASPASSDELIARLTEAINRVRHTLRLVTVEGYRARPFTVQARLAVHPDYVADAVLAQARTTLLELYQFTARDFAQDATLAEIYAALQAVPGVVYVDVDTLAFTDGEEALDGSLQGRPADVDTHGTMIAAELLTLAPEHVLLSSLAP